MENQSTPQPPTTPTSAGSGGAITNSISSEDILSQSKQNVRFPTFSIKASSTGGGSSTNNSNSNSPVLLGQNALSPPPTPTAHGQQTATAGQIGNSLSFSSTSSSPPSLSTSTSVNLSSAQTPEIRVKNHHDFKPYRSSSPCVYCGESIRQIWNPFSSHSYKCLLCGIVCHKKCLDLMNTISCSNNVYNKNKKAIGAKDGLQHSTSSNNGSLNSSSNGTPTNTSSTGATTTSINVSNDSTPPSPLQKSISSSQLQLEKNKSNTIQVPTTSYNLPAQMPTDEKIIDSMFETLMKERELQFPDTLNWTKERKWLLLVQHGNLKKEGGGGSGAGNTGGNGANNANQQSNDNTIDRSTPEYFINALKEDPTKQLFLSLHVNLRTKTISWLTNFVAMDGVGLIFSVLNQKKKETREECVRSIAIIMNSPLGLKSVTSDPVAAKRLAMVLTNQQFSLKSRAIVIELLTVMCMEKWVPGGYSMVLKALTNLKEKKRFTTFVKFIKENGSNEMKTKALCFINVLIHEPEDTSVRCKIRGEFLRLGLYDYLKSIKPNLSQLENLLTQIEIFEEMMEEDNQELEQKLNELKKQLGVDIDNIDAVFKAVKQGAKSSGLTKSLLSILQNLLVVKADPEGVKYWLLCDSLIKQVSLHRSSFEDGMDFKGLLANVDNATKEVTLTRKLEELEKQNIDKASIIQEKDLNIKSLLDIIKQVQTNGGAAITPQLDKQIKEIMKSLEPPADPSSTGAAVTTVEPVVEVVVPPTPTDPTPQPLVTVVDPTTGENPTSTGPPPPPPPMIGGPGGPPPPPPPPMKGKKNAAAIKTRPPPVVPKPAHPLKALQWVKMPAAKINESVFNILGEMNDIPLPWKEIEQEFAAKQIPKDKKVSKPRGPAQVIDGKLGQNISIFLSQFKNVPTRDIINAIQQMDDKLMNKEQVKQISKLLPSKDDMGALKEYLAVEERSKLATADQFCIDIGAYSFASEKISLFLLRSEFNQRLAEIKPDIAAVSLACDELLKSKKLMRIFEIILVLGNFINYGTVRGDQSGYKLDALIKLADTKSSDLQSNLMHTLVNYCVQSENNLLTFADEIQSLGTAKRVIWSGVVADVAMLNRDYLLCKGIVEQFQKTNEPYHESMNAFMSMASGEMEKLKKLQGSTEETFKKLCVYAGEEYGKITPDELFELFFKFIELFEAAIVYLQQLKEQEEKEAKRLLQKQLREEMKKKMGGNGSAPSTNPASGKKEDQEDDIVNDLLHHVRDGDLFRKGRRKVNSTSAPRDDNNNNNSQQPNPNSITTSNSIIHNINNVKLNPTNLNQIQNQPKSPTNSPPPPIFPKLNPVNQQQNSNNNNNNNNNTQSPNSNQQHIHFNNSTNSPSFAQNPFREITKQLQQQQGGNGGSQHIHLHVHHHNSNITNTINNNQK